MSYEEQLITSKVGEKNFQNHDVVFEFEYFINLTLKVKLGFSISQKFTPIIWLQNEKKNYIGLQREEWMALITYKDYIQLRLDQYDFFDSYNILNDGLFESLSFDFKIKNQICYLVLNQRGNRIKIDCHTFRSLTRIAIFLTTFLCWNSLLQKQISHFYYNYYIPTCANLKKTYVQLNEINATFENDTEIDLTRLCYEFGKKMTSKIKADVKIYKLVKKS